MPYGAFTTGPIWNAEDTSVVAFDVTGRITGITTPDRRSDAVIVQAKNISQTTGTVVSIRIYSIDPASGEQTIAFRAVDESLTAFDELQFVYFFDTTGTEGVKYEVVVSSNNAEFTQFSVWGIDAGLTGLTTFSGITIIPEHRVLHQELTQFA